MALREILSVATVRVNLVRLIWLNFCCQIHYVEARVVTRVALEILKRVC
jgi:hypothetical protein